MNFILSILFAGFFLNNSVQKYNNLIVFLQNPLQNVEYVITSKWKNVENVGDVMLEQNLNELNIFALRDLARRTGVNSPTSKKKEQLIKEIVEIISGEKKPQETKSKQGRPPKVFGYDFANDFSNQLSLGESVPSLSKQTLNQNVVEVKQEDVITVAGWIEMVNNNSALLWVEKNFKNENYFVSSEVMKNLQVKMGDRVVAEISADDGSKVVKKIFSINDCPVKQPSHKRVDYENIEHNLPSKVLKFKNADYENLNLMVGENVYVYGSNNNDNTKKIIDMLNSCKIENKIYINVSIAEKNKIFLKSLQCSEKFLSNITDENDISKRVVLLAIERAKRILEVNENVLVVVDDISSVMGVNENLVKNLVSITKDGGNGSITLLAVMPGYEINQVEKLADRRLKIIGDRIENV